MLYPMPSNAIPFFVLGVVATVFGLRGLLFYKKSKLPLSLYYSLAVLLIGVANILYSVPYVFSHNSDLLKMITNIGDYFYYASILVSARIVWYLGFNKKISFLWLLVPYSLIIISCQVAIIKSWSSIQYQFYGSDAYFPVDPLACKLFAAMSTAYILVGIFTIQQAYTIKDLRQKLRLNSIGIGFLAGGMVAIYNYLFLQGSNTNFVATVGYIAISVILFIGIFVVGRRGKS